MAEAVKITISEKPRPVVKEEPPEFDYSYDVPENDFYIARINELKAENKRLRDKIGVDEEYIAHQEWVQEGIDNEARALLEEKDAEIAELKAEVAKLKDKIVRLA